MVWHLLSLDAPTVAVVWTMFAASVTHTVLPLATPVAMALAVWTLYAADRLLDSRGAGASSAAELEARHLFHHRHRRWFAAGIAVSTAMLAVLLPRLPGAAIRLYLTEGAFMAGYFLLIHVAPEASVRVWVPKELLVGPFFAAAIFIPTVARHPELRFGLLPLAALFAALCSLNCVYLYAWEHPRMDRASWATRYAVRGLRWVTVGVVVAGVALCFMGRVEAGWMGFPLACAVSAVGLGVLHRVRLRVSTVVLRAMADAVLLTPVLVMPFLGARLWGWLRA